MSVVVAVAKSSQAICTCAPLQGEMLVNMAFLAIVGSSKVNGVAAIHTEILKAEVLADFYSVRLRLTFGLCWRVRWLGQGPGRLLLGAPRTRSWF